MQSSERTLPLFPLNTVVFPGVSIPLQIFEDRYKRLLQDCLAMDSKFGIVLIKNGTEVGEPAESYSTGTIVQIIHTNEIDGGRFILSATGIQRFVIREILQRRPYISARVELLYEDEDAWLPITEMEVIRRAFTKYSRLVSGLTGGWVRQAHGSSDPAAFSYQIARTLRVDIHEKQSLLEESSAPKRLETELDILRRDSERLSRRLTIELMGRFGRQ